MTTQFSIAELTDLVHTATGNFTGQLPSGVPSTSQNRISWAAGIHQGLIDPINLGVTQPLRVVRITLTMAGQSTWTLDTVDGVTVTNIASGTTETTYSVDEWLYLTSIQKLRLVTTGGGTTSVRMVVTVAGAQGANGTDFSAYFIWNGSKLTTTVPISTDDPVDDQDVATKKYVDDNAGGGGLSGFGAFGSSPNAAGASVSGATITLQPADATHPGGVTTGVQSFAGDKTFTEDVTANSITLGAVESINVPGNGRIVFGGGNYIHNISASGRTDATGGWSANGVASGSIAYESENGARWAFSTADASAYLARNAANVINTPGKLTATTGLGVGNSVSATVPGTVVKKLEIFDANGVSLGFIPIYDAIV